MTDEVELPKVYKNNWAKTMKVIVPHLWLIRGVQGIPLAYVIRQYVMGLHIVPGYDAFLKLGKKIFQDHP